VIEYSGNKPKWLEQLHPPHPENVAVVTLPNKVARTTWALVAHAGDEYPVVGRPLPTADVGCPGDQLEGQLSGGDVARPTGATLQRHSLPWFGRREAAARAGRHGPFRTN
jgi:hypothetical protein